MGQRQDSTLGTPARAGLPPTVQTFPIFLAHPVHLNHICVPVLSFYSLWIQLWREKKKEDMSEKERDDSSETTPELSLLVSNCS